MMEETKKTDNGKDKTVKRKLNQDHIDGNLKLQKEEFSINTNEKEESSMVIELEKEPDLEEINKINTDKYNRNDIGPFEVILEKENLRAINIGKLFKNIKIDKNIIIQQSGKNRVKIITKKFFLANQILNNEFLAKIEKIKSFIPKSCIISTYLMRNIPTDMTEEEIKLEMGTPAPIIKIDRMHKWCAKQQQKIPTENVKIVLRTVKKPESLTIYNTAVRFDYYIPLPTMCFNCQRYGHISKICKAEKVCRTCSKIHEEDKCSKIPFCRYCNEDHIVNSRSCKERNVRFRINKIRITKRISFLQAKEEFEREFSSNPSLRRRIESEANRSNNEHKFNKKINELEINLKKTSETLNNIRRIWSNFSVDSENIDKDHIVLQIAEALGHTPLFN